MKKKDIIKIKNKESPISPFSKPPFNYPIEKASLDIFMKYYKYLLHP